MGRRNRKGRDVNGILILDKPPGLTSNGALQVAKRLFNASKAGHTGSLDPLATGVLPLCFGEATKFSQYLLEADKHYLVTMKLGIATDSGDADGQVIATAAVPVLARPELEGVLDDFRGEITQIPSMYSAIKVNGQPLYKLARQGIEIERKSRQVTIHELILETFDADSVTLSIRCSKGTYVRSIAEDLGKVLGCGAHVSALRRLKSGPFGMDQAVSLQRLQEISESDGFAAMDALLEPVCSAVQNWPSVELTAITASYLKQGQAIQVSHAPTEGWVRIFSESAGETSDFIGVGEILDDGKVAPRKLVASGR